MEGAAAAAAAAPAPPAVYDERWAKSHIGLPLAMPDNWWPGYEGCKTITKCEIVSYEPDRETGDAAYWGFSMRKDLNVLDTEVYYLNYKGVLRVHRSAEKPLKNFDLPAQPRRPGARRIAPAAARRDRTRNVAPAAGPAAAAAPAQFGNTTEDQWDYLGKVGKGKPASQVPFTGRPAGLRDPPADWKDLPEDQQFGAVFSWMLPRFGGQNYFEFLRDRIGNYMDHCIATKEDTPRFYKGL